MAENFHCQYSSKSELCAWFERGRGCGGEIGKGLYCRPERSTRNYADGNTDAEDMRGFPIAPLENMHSYHGSVERYLHCDGHVAYRTTENPGSNLEMKASTSLGGAIHLIPLPCEHLLRAVNF